MITNLNVNTLCQHYLNKVYQNTFFHEDDSQDKRVTDTYGEILYTGVAKILATFPLTKQDSFVDLGSGQGKLALQVFLTTAAKLVTGIELSQNLHQQALSAKQQIQRELPDIFANHRQLNFMQGDFFQIPFHHATVVLLGSVCFSPTFMLSLGHIINSIPTINTVMTLRPIANLIHLPFKTTLRVECSWDAALCYVYSKLF